MTKINRRSFLALGGGAALGAAGALGISDTAEAADWKRLVVVTANVGRDRKENRERAIHDVRNAVKDQLPIVGWQEIGGGDGDNKEQAWINHYFGDRYTNVFDFTDRFGAERQVPISVPKTYKILRRRSTRTHRGLANVSPDRFINQLALQHRQDPGLKFVIANTHYVPGAWNGEENTAEAWRQRNWRRHFQAHREVLTYWRNLGFPVFWTGDVNRHRMPLLLPNHEHRATPPEDIDQVRWVQGTNGVQITVRRSGQVQMYVDKRHPHDALYGVFDIRHRG